MSAERAVRDGLVRRGVALEIFTLSWMTVEAVVAMAAGVAAGSVALLAFGIDSIIEFVAALVILRTFRAEQTGRDGVCRCPASHADAFCVEATRRDAAGERDAFG